MNRDPFGLGVLLYGMRPRPDRVLTAAAWAVGPLAEREFELAHAGCSLATFCRNPLHPGPCKGWKKKLGVEAPGALKALEKAHGEKVAARRVATAEAKSTASKGLKSEQLASPLRAKKTVIKNANIILGNDEAKAAGKADRVILNKAEIKRYSKIKAAQVNAMRAKQGLEEDPGLEDRLAEAFAADNQTGRDERYRAALEGSAASLGAQLAEKHCKKGDGDCDGKPYESLRKMLTDAAYDALLTGDDEGLDGRLAGYESGKLKPPPAVLPKGATDAEKKAAEKAAWSPSNYGDALSSFEKLDRDDFKSLDAVTRTKAVEILKMVANDPDQPQGMRDRAAALAAKWTPPGMDTLPLGTQNQLDLAKAIKSGTLDDIAEAHGLLSESEKKGLPKSHKPAIDKANKHAADVAKAKAAEQAEPAPAVAGPAEGEPEASAPTAPKYVQSALKLAGNWKNETLHHKDFLTQAKKIDKETFDGLSEEDQKLLRSRAELLSKGVGSTGYDAKKVASVWAGTYKPHVEDTSDPAHVADVKAHLAGGKPKSTLPTSMLYAQVSGPQWEKYFTKEQRAAAHAALSAIAAKMSPNANDAPGVKAAIANLEGVDPDLKSAPPAAPEGSTPKKLTLKEAGLKPGDQVWLHTHNGGGGVDTGPKSKPGDKPVLATVKAEKHGGYGGAKGTVTTNLVGPDGEYINGGSPAAKYWISPKDGGEFPDPAPKAKAAGPPAAPEPSPVPAIDMVKTLFAEGVGSQHDVDVNAKLEALGDISRDDFDSLSFGAQVRAFEFLENQQKQYGPGTDTHAEVQALKVKFGWASAPAPAGAKKSVGELLDVNATADHEALVKAVPDLGKAGYDDLTSTQKAIGSQLLSDAVQAGIPGAAAAKAHWDSLAPAKAEPAPAPAAPAGKLAADISPDVKAASDYAHGFKSGTAKAKLAAYEKVTADEFAQLAPSAQQVILADLKAVENKLIGPKSQQAADHWNYLSAATGGGAGAGGIDTLDPQIKLNTAMDDVGLLYPLIVPVGAKTDAATVANAKAQFEGLAQGAGQPYAAQVFGDMWAKIAVGKLDKMHGGSGGTSYEAGEAEALEAALASDLTKKLSGTAAPTPTLDAYKKAVNLASFDDFLAAVSTALAHPPLPGPPASSTAPTPSVLVTGKPSVPGGAAPLGSFGESLAFTGFYADDEPMAGVLFSAYKSAHKGTVLSHSIEDNFNNLLAVAAHYRGNTDASGHQYPDDLSVLQVARAVDRGISKSLGVSNGNVLEKRISDWLSTPAGQKYAASHPEPGKKWVDNLSGTGSAAQEAAKAGLTVGAPVGKRVQRPKATVSGKVPKYDPDKDPMDFKPLTAEEMARSQAVHMDDAGTSWTAGQAESLANYTTGAYHEINSYLRGADRNGNPVDSISDLGLQRVALIQNGMRPLQQDTQLKRGTGWHQFPEPFRSVEGVKKMLGKTFKDEAFVSTTVGGEFGEFQDSVALIIEAPAGTPAAWVREISHNSGENEVVLAAGTKFRVTKVEPTGNTGAYGTQVTVTVRVVG